MDILLLISDDVGRSASLARDLESEWSVRIHDLDADLPAIEPVRAIVCDFADLSPHMVARLRHLFKQSHRGGPLVVLLRRDHPRARLLAMSLGASKTLSPPFDLQILHTALRLWAAPAKPPAKAARRAEMARLFYGGVFVPDRPIAPRVIDNGTELVEQAIHESGIRDWI